MQAWKQFLGTHRKVICKLVDYAYVIFQSMEAYKNMVIVLVI